VVAYGLNGNPSTLRKIKAVEILIGIALNLYISLEIYLKNIKYSNP
jgi:hypothetical protein